MKNLCKLRKCCATPEPTIVVIDGFDIYEETQIVCANCKKELKEDEIY